MDIKITSDVNNLYKYSENGDYISLKKLTDEKDFSQNSLDTSIRKLIDNYEVEKMNNYIKSLNLLLSLNININYKNINNNENGSTIIMKLVGKGDKKLLDTFIKILDENNNKENNINNNNNININKNKIINYEIYDNNNNNILTYLFYRNSLENDAIEIFNYLYYNNNINNIKTIIEKFYYELDSNGNCPLSICLQKSWWKFTKLLLKLFKIKNNFCNKIKNNFIHCAVNGKSLICLEMILIKIYESIFNDNNNNNNNISFISYFKSKNSDNFTPYFLAMQKEKITFAMIIEYFEKKFSNKFFIKIFEEKYKDIFNNNNNENNNNNNNENNNNEEENVKYFKENKYDFLIEKLNYEKAILNTMNDDLKNNNNNNKENKLTNLNIVNYSLNWNILLCEFMKIKLKINNNNNNLEKEIQKINKEFEKFFNEFSLLIINNTNNNENYNNNENKIKVDILIYNNIIYYYKTKNHKKFFYLINLYFKYYFNNNNNNNNNNFYKFSLFLMISFLIIEIFIAKKYYKLSEKYIKLILEFLFKNNHKYKDFNYFPSFIFDYFNDEEIFNQFSKNWDEIFAYLNLLKIIINFNKNHNNFNGAFDEYEKLIKNCVYKRELKVFNKLNLIYKFLLMKKNYINNENDINLINEIYNEKNDYFYFYNNIAIIFMKKKFFRVAIYFLKISIKIIYNKNSYNNNNINIFDNKLFNIKKIYYNIALCYFYIEKYDLSKTIFEKILNNNNKINNNNNNRNVYNNNNYLLYYRLALCNIMIFLHNKKKKENKINDIIYNYIDGTNINNINNNNNNYTNDKNLFYFNDNNNIIYNNNNYKNNNCKNNINDFDEILIQYEKENNSENESDDDNSNLSTSTKTNNNDFIILNKKENNNRKRFILNTNNNNNKNKTKNNNKNNINMAILYLKKTIFLCKIHNNNSNLKNLYEFYKLISEDNEEEEEEKKIYQIQFNKRILIHSYINLFYCLSLKKNYMEILLYIQNLKNFIKKNYNINKDSLEINEINNIIFHYEIEAKFYIYKNNVNNINNLIKDLEDKLNNNNNNIESKFYINKNKELKYKFILLYRLCIMYIKNKNFCNAENSIKNMFNIINNNNNNNIELPSEFINIIIYFNLMKLNDKNYMKENYDKENKIKNNIINMIKYKKNIIFNNNNNNNINYNL